MMKTCTTHNTNVQICKVFLAFRQMTKKNGDFTKQLANVKITEKKTKK